MLSLPNMFAAADQAVADDILPHMRVAQEMLVASSPSWFLLGLQSMLLGCWPTFSTFHQDEYSLGLRLPFLRQTDFRHPDISLLLPFCRFPCLVDSTNGPHFQHVQWLTIKMQVDALSYPTVLTTLLIRSAAADGESVSVAINSTTTFGWLGCSCTTDRHESRAVLQPPHTSPTPPTPTPHPRVPSFRAP